MPQKPNCPDCGGKLEIKALVDSHDRIWQRWRYCPDAGCGFDERTSMQKSVCVAVGIEN